MNKDSLKDPLDELLRTMEGNPNLIPAEAAERIQKIAERGARLSAEERPILLDLRSVGVDVTTIWSQHLGERLTPEGMEILAKHLRLPYSCKTREGLARALARPSAHGFWSLLVSEYKTASEGLDEDGFPNGYKDGLASALGAMASKSNLEELIELVRDRTNGSSRLLLLVGLRRSRDPRAAKVLDDLADDPDLAKEIAHWKKRRKPKP